jgi:hypothetical protein
MTWRQIARYVLAAILLVPATRHWMEGDMALHMLLEFSLLIAAGATVFDLLPRRVHARFSHWNHLGLTGFVVTSLTLAYWMIPAALDASIASTGVALAKYGSLLLSGLALRSSLALAPTVVQAFFVGNLAWMTATVGLLYQDNPRQLCLYYPVDAQIRAGSGLVLLAVFLGAAWCANAARRISAIRQ